MTFLDTLKVNTITVAAAFGGVAAVQNADAAPVFDQIVTEDFETPEVSSPLFTGTSYEAPSNLNFGTSNLAQLSINPADSAFTVDTQQLVVNDPTNFSITYNDGEAFIPVSIDIDNIFTGFDWFVDVFFETQSGDTIGTTFDIDSTRGLQTLTFEGLFSDDDPVTSWTFANNSQPLTYDNVTIATIPTPASAALLALGGVVAGLRRRP